MQSSDASCRTNRTNQTDMLPIGNTTPPRQAWYRHNLLIETQIDVLLVEESPFPDSLPLFIRCRNQSLELNCGRECGTDDKSLTAN